ncbi:hypothetical protein ACFQPA_05415 [Halomarina halobia]|uniref:Uncharacterized protein n=1 Tax=Halomarina halobia TaxID=3033386 RepID=A0ABD6A5M5_9EURY|nr:hypothetical protein [Halomarina sp. PSR21]
MTTETGAGAFAQALAAMKRQGSSLLVVGSACGRSHLSACRRLLGEDGDGERRRVVVLTDGPPELDVRVPSGDREEGEFELFDRRPATRSVAAATTASPGLPPTLGTLEAEVRGTIDEFDAAADGLESAELRVCIDSLRPLLEGYDEDDVVSFLDGVIDATLDANGMCHAHLPVDPDNGVVERLKPLFDATIELRELHIPSENGETPRTATEQRWHLHEEDISTDWLPL